MIPHDCGLALLAEMAFAIPVWIQVTLAVGTGLTVLVGAWTKAIRPFIRAAGKVEEATPVIAELVKQWKDVPDIFPILKEIVAQVRTDSGSSIKDDVTATNIAVVEMRGLIKEAAVVAAKLALNKEALERQYAEDRANDIKRVKHMEQLTADVAELTASVRTLLAQNGKRE